MYQNNLNDFRKWHEEIQRLRDQETKRLYAELGMAEAKIRLMKDLLIQEKIRHLKEYRRAYPENYDDEDEETDDQDEDKEVSDQDKDKEVNEQDVEHRVFYDGPRSELSQAERRYELAWEWKWKIKRRLHDLIREERDDLEHLARLESRERYKHRPRLETRATSGSQEPEITRSGKNRQHKKVSHRAKPA